MTTSVHYSLYTLPCGKPITKTELFFKCGLISAQQHIIVGRGRPCGRTDVIKERVMWGNLANLLNHILIYRNHLTWPQSQPSHIYKLSIKDSFLAVINAHSGISLHSPPLSKLEIEQHLCSAATCWNFLSTVVAYQFGVCEEWDRNRSGWLPKTLMFV